MEFLAEPMAWPVLFPVLAGLVCLLIPDSRDRLRGALAVGASAVTVLLVWPVFRARGACPALSVPWLSLRCDPLAGFVLLAIAVLGLLVGIYSLGYMAGKERLRAYYSSLLLTIGFSCGAVLANDLILLLVFWGLLGLTLYMMMGVAGPDAAAAAKKTFIIIGGSDCFLLLGIVIVWVLRGTTRMSGAPLPFAGEMSWVAFLCFAGAAFAKAGAMPLHSWVPDCGEKAPLAVTAFLPGSLDKLLGIYLLARTVGGLFAADMRVNMLLMLVGAGTVVCAVMMALIQHDLKRLLSYHAVSQVGYMVLGIGTGTAVGIAGGLFHMLNNSIYKACLFLCAGSVEKRAGSTDLDKLGGLAGVMPITFGACVVAALAISGVPPLNGFTSKWMIYQGIVEAGKTGGHLWVVWLAAAMLGSALTLASFVKVLHAVFLCKPSPELAGKEVREVGVAMWLPTALLAAACIAFGVLAFRLVLTPIIFPAVGGEVTMPGIWRAGPATLMLLVGYGAGALFYFLTTARKARECPTYIGGEILEEMVVGDEPPSATRSVEMTGVDFYRSIEGMVLLRGFYRAARAKWFDVYDVGSRATFYFVEALRSLHSGRLPMYLTWLLVGFLLVLYVVVYGGRTL